MKQVLKIQGLIIFLFIVVAALAQDDEKKNWPKIEFEDLIHDFGDIPYNASGDYDFVFKNVGKGPLIIKKVQSS